MSLSKEKMMKMDELINYLSTINPSKTINFVANVENPEDEFADVSCSGLEVWDDGLESVTIFMSRRK
jgi:hypothetical protein